MVIVSVFLILKTCVEYGFVVGVPSSLILYSLRGYPFITCYNFLIFLKIDMLTRYFFLGARGGCTRFSLRYRVHLRPSVNTFDKYLQIH